MKKYFIFALAAVAALAACTKEGGKEEAAKPIVTFAADYATFDANLNATLTLTLSEAAAADVTVALEDADVQSGKSVIPATYGANVTFKAGETTKEVAVKADATGLEDGEYQAAIKIASANGAELGAIICSFIDLSYAANVAVNLYTGGDFIDSYTSYLTLGLEKAVSKDVKVVLETVEGSTAPLEYTKEVTIPAGEKSVDVDVILNPETLVTGEYTSTIQIASVEGAKAGTSTTARYNISFPILPCVVIDGDLSDWENAVTQDIVNPEDSYYNRHLSVKFTASSTYLYMLYEVEGKSSYGSIMSDFMIDKDGNPATGGAYDDFWAVGCSGIEWYVEQCLTVMGGGYANGCGYGLYKYGGLDGEGLFNWNNDYGEYNDPAIMYWWVDDDAPDSGIIRYECWFNRAFFGLTGTTCRVGFRLFDWGDGTCGEGRAPQLSGTEAYTPCDMFTVHMPVFEEE